MFRHLQSMQTVCHILTSNFWRNYFTVVNPIKFFVSTKYRGTDYIYCYHFIIFWTLMQSGNWMQLFLYLNELERLQRNKKIMFKLQNLRLLDAHMKVLAKMLGKRIFWYFLVYIRSHQLKRKVKVFKTRDQIFGFSYIDSQTY